MRFELFLVMIFFLSILLICAELLWLYLLADNQEESKAKLNKKVFHVKHFCFYRNQVKIKK